MKILTLGSLYLATVLSCCLSTLSSHAAGRYSFPAVTNTWVGSTPVELQERFGAFVYNHQTSLQGIRGHHAYVPDQTRPSAKPIVMVVIHGTWSATSKHFYDYEDQQGFYRSVAHFMQNYACAKQTSVELVSYRWNGENSSYHRHYTGAQLAKFLEAYYADYQIMLLGHSHGCNVITHACQYPLPNGARIDTIITLAAPVRDLTDELFRPRYVNHVVQFYSTSDLVAALGALTQKNIYRKEGSIRKFAPIAGGRVSNIRTQINGADTGHSDIRGIMPSMSEIMQKLEAYTYNSSFDLNVNTKAHDALSSVQLAVRGPYVSAHRLVSASTGTDATTGAQQFALEYTMSEQDKAIYRKLYNRAIEYKAPAPMRFFNGVIAEVKQKLQAVA